MKKDIHPKYNSEAKAVCACGNKLTVGSTVSELEVELCSACHPFYTGKQKLVDTARRVEKFKERDAKKSADALKAKKAKEAKRLKEKKEKRDKANSTK